MRSLTSLAGLLSVLAAVTALPQADNATIQGFTKEGLAVMNAEMKKWVDTKQGAGVVTLLARNGEIVDHSAYGVMDSSAATKSEIQKDSIFRIMSMSKPIVGVLMMMFFEDGKFKLDDDVSKHVPEFANLKVKNGSQMVPQATPMKMFQLLSHSAGFASMLTVPSPTLGTIIEPLIKAQLGFQPGKDWQYGPGVEVQGYLIEKWAGKDLSDILQERLLVPLGMKDTGFWVDPSKVSRVPKVVSARSGSISVLPMSVPTSKPKKLFPSGGLHGTAQDYFLLCQMLLNGGEYKGKRYLKKETVDLMHKNVLEPGVKVKFGEPAGIGFGLDFAIVLDPKPGNNNQPKGSYYWGGLYGTWFWIDPVNNVTFVGLIQNIGAPMTGPTSLRQISAKAAYAAMKSS
ncbi:beta-lactamase/transpeptidase-like protein [Microthyrium microscopicum]|uniref:Beta-lactamase/transpeptidase-like protein n=1 Tax=Microthyrium microscopicum TaxID=703497 RepID=A0A6A6U6H3_9PEZI|nr:beta-lactamase/transpeptidase-like protein [Microthyrium microscopicum]